MRILWLTTMLPWPPDSGGRQDPYYTLREFSRLGHKMTSAVIFHEGKIPDIPPEISELVESVHFIPGNPNSLLKRLMTSLSDKIPFKFRKYHSGEGVEKLYEILSGKPGFDAVVAYHLHLSPLLQDCIKKLVDAGIAPPKIVMRAPNVESTIVSKYSDRIDNPLVKIFASAEAEKMKAYETGILSEFDLVAAISPVDKTVFDKMTGGRANAVSITAGVDIDEIRPSDTSIEKGEVVFVGSFDWHPNVDGALWLIEKVWPKVLGKFPSAHLSLVGRKPPPYLEKAAGKNISITGRVESVEEFIQKATCIVVPLWIGSGMRLKILEAFAYGKAVVSTSLGAEGIEAIDGEHIIIRDDPDQFALAVIDILTNEKIRNKISSNARTLVEMKYSWKKVALDFVGEIEKLMNRG